MSYVCHSGLDPESSLFRIPRSSRGMTKSGHYYAGIKEISNAYYDFYARCRESVNSLIKIN